METYGLNDEQLKAIRAPSPVVCFASAGAGKTRTLIAKISSLLDAGTSPGSILGITFTNKAANEMKSRLKGRYPNLAGMQISTIHSMCVRIIRTFIQHTPLKHPFTIYDDGDQYTVMKTVLKARKRTDDIWGTLSIISRAKSDGIDTLPSEYDEIYKAYQDILKTNNACDFDDLLIYAADCVKKEDCKRFFQNTWRHILVDEFQDTSNIQYSIILALFDPQITQTMFAVGDENQSIYAWRGARPDNMQDFIDRYKPSLCHLTYNYRSGSSIIKHANSFLQFGKEMVAKTASTGMVGTSVFSTQEDEAGYIGDAILKMGNFENTAILYRINARSINFEKAFAARRIPYKVIGDIPFYRRKVVKNLLAYCKAAVNRSDIESLTRIVNVPKRGFGEVKQERLLKEGWAFLNEYASESNEISDFISLLNDIRSKPPAEAIGEILTRTHFQATLEKESDGSMVEALINVSSAFKDINELILASTFLEEDSGKGVKLMTAHASKGLEFDRVFVVGVEDGIWPHKMSADLAEEERLYYVAVTRARQWLNISYARSKMNRGAALPVAPSNLFMRSAELTKSHSTR